MPKAVPATGKLSDNGLGHFALAATATTAPNGPWSAPLAAGPSRLVEAYYAGASTFEPSVSAQVHVVVPAKVKLLSVWPPRVAWGGTVRIMGQLIGGYLPPGGALVRLRIGQGRRIRPMACRSTSPGTGDSRPLTSSGHAILRPIAASGSRSQRCRWATIRRPRRGAGRCWSAGTRARR
jgi:hypothetical protein